MLLWLIAVSFRRLSTHPRVSGLRRLTTHVGIGTMIHTRMKITHRTNVLHSAVITRQLVTSMTASMMSFTPHNPLLHGPCRTTPGHGSHRHLIPPTEIGIIGTNQRCSGLRRVKGISFHTLVHIRGLCSAQQYQ